MYAGYIPVGSPRTGAIFMSCLLGIYGQYYLRKYKPRIFKHYMWVFVCGLDAGSSITMFILTFAVLGVGGKEHPFPIWWGNNQNDYSDWCPVPDST